MPPTFSPESLPNRFDHAEARPRLYAWWESQGLFHAEPNRGRPPYAIVIPPPNVTGALHLGHALNNSLQDILIRMKRMQGFETLWMPGTDHAGIATQAVVERRLKEEENKTRHDLGREQLVRRIWEWKDQYENRILGQLKQMGCSCDWRRTRFTLDEVCARAVRATFFDLFRKGLIYRGKRLVNWDTFLQTVVSDDEVFHEEVKGHFWHFQYPVIDPQPGEPAHVTIATTRPETMLGDTAVAVHPNPAAALDGAEAGLLDKLSKAPVKEREDIQQELDAVRERRQTLLPQLEQLRDMALAGRKLLLPLVNRVIPLVADEWAKPELGSGCVKITPAHDANDYDVAQRQDLPMVNILNPNGTLNANAGKYQGLTVLAARKQVVADLETLGLVAAVEDRLIDLAHSDRSKTPIEPYLADQWFVKMDQLAQAAMQAVIDGRVRILPQRYTQGYLDWLAEKRDWPVGRQLWWGHQIPVWSYTGPSDKIAQVRRQFEIPESFPINEVFQPQDRPQLAAQVIEGPNEGERTVYICVAPGHQQDERILEQAGLHQEQDVLDTWFSSALWPHSTLGWPERTPELDFFYPTSVLITSRDIITLWVARMVLMGVNNMGQVPFPEVFIHPKILDGYGETMSKTKGNGIDPLDVIDKFGADALRFGMAHLTTETQDVRMPVQFECPHCETLIEQTKKNRELPRIKCDKCGQAFSTQWARSDEDRALPRGPVVSERFEVARNFCNKLWNAARFALINLKDYTPAPVPDAELTLEDRWVLSRLATVTQQVTDALETYHYSDAARILYDFAWDEFCSFFLEIVKNRMQDENQRPHAQRSLAHTLDILLRLLHPIMPFITEEIWQLLAQVAPQRGLDDPQPASGSIMIAPWPQADTARQNVEIEAQFARFQAVLGALREIRSRQNIPPKSQIDFGIRCEAETEQLLRPMAPYLLSMAGAVATAWGPAVTPPATHAAVTLPIADVYVDLKDFIDVAAEIARNEKLTQKLRGQIVGKERKLSTASFVEKAPAEVVQRERESLKQLQEQLAAAQAALENLRKLQPQGQGQTRNV
ncbi:MAG TPA: valine--tRNA ligase [Candidatus Anammoximicrobium sp.]|nr:valine--tRNA ligase [Candidatus Anammoximicrobium sp.]